MGKLIWFDVQRCVIIKMQPCIFRERLCTACERHVEPNQTFTWLKTSITVLFRLFIL